MHNAFSVQIYEQKLFFKNKKQNIYIYIYIFLKVGSY